jgi:AraC-like DNA-binding protein
MLVRFRFPGPPLSQFVNRIWLYEGYTQPHGKERLLPDGSMGLVINLAQDEVRIYDRQNHERFERFRGAVICGAQSEFFVIDTASQAAVIGVSFKPGGAFPFLGMPSTEFKDRHVCPGDVWGLEAGHLREHVLEAATPEGKFDVLERFLLAKAHGKLRRHPAVNYALREFSGVPHTRTIAEVTDQIGLSARRFIEVFSNEVGLTPKLFCRVRRFQQALNLSRVGFSVEWADVAASCGYFDQAHFIRDFRGFSGINPMAYLGRRTEHLNHVPIA